MRQILQENTARHQPLHATETGSHQDACLEPEPDVDDMLLLPLHINEARNPWG